MPLTFQWETAIGLTPTIFANATPEPAAVMARSTGVCVINVSQQATSTNQQYVYLINIAISVNSVFMTTKHSGDRLKYLLRSRGLSASQFAAEFGISNQMLNNWFVRGIPGRHLLSVARRLGMNPEWLESGAGEPHYSKIDEDYRRLSAPEKVKADQAYREWNEAHSPTTNIEPAIQPRRSFEYPEVSWVQAGSPSEAIDPSNIALCPRHSSDVWAGEGGFWLKVTGNSMTSSGPASFPEGHLILVAPDLEPRPGQFVVARLVDSNEATFKQLVKDAGDLYLRPLNPAFPVKELTDSWEIVGTVVDGKMPKSLFS
ncbi:LexA family transcriptional regulator [Pseudomonas sp. ICMP 10191]|uniref:LexA family transcriptional regulator n=1 Tax=Pseudomonas sp. ICMP 10191 TaxID=1198294 RepID=UPI000B2550CD|nr:XRE family transcriptional regulator [Pseudomonas sp. ICMP 10191]